MMKSYKPIERISEVFGNMYDTARSNVGKFAAVAVIAAGAVSGCGGGSAIAPAPILPVGAISQGTVTEIQLKQRMSDEGYGFQTGAAEEAGIKEEGYQSDFDSIGYQDPSGKVSSWWAHIDEEVEKDLGESDGVPAVFYFVGMSDGDRFRAYGLNQDSKTGTRTYGLEKLVGKGQGAYNTIRDTVTF